MIEGSKVILGSYGMYIIYKYPGECSGGNGRVKVGKSFFRCVGRININPKKIGTSVKMAIVNINAIFHYSNFPIVKKTLYFNLVNYEIEKRVYFVNIGITYPAVAAGGNKGSRRLPVWLLRISVLFGIPTRMLFLVVRLLLHKLEG